MFKKSTKKIYNYNVICFNLKHHLIVVEAPWKITLDTPMLLALITYHSERIQQFIISQSIARMKSPLMLRKYNGFSTFRIQPVLTTQPFDGEDNTNHSK